MAKNPLGKGRDVESPYATFEANGFEYRIAKTYKLAKNEAADQYKAQSVMGDHKSVIIDARAAIKTATTICNPSS